MHCSTEGESLCVLDRKDPSGEFPRRLDHDSASSCRRTDRANASSEKEEALVPREPSRFPKGVSPCHRDHSEICLGKDSIRKCPCRKGLFLHPPLDSKLPNPGYTIRDRGQIPLPNDSILFHPEVAAANRWNWVEPYNASSAAGVADQSSVAVEADNAADWSVIVVGVVVVVVVAAEPEGASTRERWTKALDFRTRSTDSCPL
mmetsp:Transcript_6885/g.17262  ORF Transcript_6885/g.17262 Transcript_6885/m.17262 type:complete len:203 (+) Transcript_6885:1382-1990(+)